MPSLVEELAPDMIVPKGFICSTVQQLMVGTRPPTSLQTPFYLLCDVLRLLTRLWTTRLPSAC